MQMIVLAGLRAATPAVMLKYGVDIVCDLDLPILFAHQLLHPLPRRVVEIVRMHRRLGACSLRAEGFHMVAVVPLEVARSRLRSHIAIGIVKMRLRSCG